MNRARDVQELVVYVKERVYQWVKTHRGAVQTPIAWGISGSNFLLPKPARAAGLFRDSNPMSRLHDSPWQNQEAEDLWNRLVARYRRSDEYADQRPYRYAPLAWREYQETLLRAERLYRAGLFQEGRDAINSLDGLEQELKNPFPPLPNRGYPSLEMGLRIASDSGFHPEWGEDRQWERALTWPPPQTPPASPDKSKQGSAAKKQAGGIISSEISDQADADAGATEKSKPRLPEVLAMIAEGKNPWGTFVEGQFIDWAIEWTKLHPNPVFLSQGKPADDFCQALKVRRLAEQAVCASWQSGPWSDALLQAGDAARRQAQDDLFLGEQHSDSVKRHLNEAEIAYERAVKYGKALDLIQQIRVEWPFLGDWKVRRAASLGQREVSRTAEFIVNFTSRVTDLDSRLNPWTSRESPTAARIADFEREFDAAQREFDQIKNEFKSALDAQTPSSFSREIDDLLRVPMIPSKVREKLVETAVTRSLQDALQPVPKATQAKSTQAVDDRAAVKQTDDKAAVKQADGKSDVTPAGGRPEAKQPASPTEPADNPPGDKSATDTSLEPEDGPEPDAVADEAFWAQASGMALLEWSLLSIANVVDGLPVGTVTREANQPLAKLREEITSAGQIDWRSDPAKAYEYQRDRVAARLRSLRSRLIETCTMRSRGLGELEELWDENHRSRLFLQRAMIALPRPQVDEVDMRVGAGNPRFAKLSADLAGFNLRASLLRQARRLLDDLDVKRASSFLKLAEGLGNENSEVLKVRQNLEAMQVATIKIHAATAVLDGDTHEKTMEVLIEPRGQVPKGRAVISFGPDQSNALHLLRNDAQAASADVSLGAPVQVDPDRPPAKVSYLVQRGVNGEDREGIPLIRAALKRACHHRCSTAAKLTRRPSRSRSSSSRSKRSFTSPCARITRPYQRAFGTSSACTLMTVTSITMKILDTKFV